MVQVALVLAEREGEAAVRSVVLSVVPTISHTHVLVLFSFFDGLPLDARRDISLMTLTPLMSIVVRLLLLPARDADAELRPLHGVEVQTRLLAEYVQVPQ